MSSAPVLSPSDRPADGKAYIFARLDERVPRDDAAPIDYLFNRAQGAELALIIANVSKNREYIFEFENTSDVRVIEVDPGYYRINEMLTYSEYGWLRGRNHGRFNFDAVQTDVPHDSWPPRDDPVQ